MQDTLVLVWGEFGRTPRINKDAGRDHWPGAQSVVLAGGGMTMGQAIGSSDARAELPRERPLTPEDVLATMYAHLGIDGEHEFLNEAQRPLEDPQRRHADPGAGWLNAGMIEIAAMHRFLAFLFAFLAAAPAFGQLPAARLEQRLPVRGAAGRRRSSARSPALTSRGPAGSTSAIPASRPSRPGRTSSRCRSRRTCPSGRTTCGRSRRAGCRTSGRSRSPTGPRSSRPSPTTSPAKAQAITLPVVVNGRIDKPTDVDCYRFTAKQGQRVFIDCWAWRVDSQLDGTIMVYDDQGKELGYSGDFAGKDPFLDFTAPADGAYVVKVWDFIYGGSSDHFYRLQIGSVPHLDAVIPAAVHPGETTTIMLLGRNLPGGTPVPGSPGSGPALETISQTIEVPAEPGREVDLARRRVGPASPGDARRHGLPAEHARGELESDLPRL